MGFKLSEAYIELKANTGPLESGLLAAKNKVAGIVGEMKASMGGLASAFLPMLAVGGALEGLRAAIVGASDLAETMSKVDEVFGSASQNVKAFGDEMAQSFGANRREMLDAAAGFGLVAKAAGLTQDAAADLSVDLARLADDASSFYNVPLVEALQTIKSAMVGESEPIRRFGVLLNEDAVKAEALRLGLTGTNKQLTESAKVMARVSLIQRGMTDATGDHIRTQAGFANQWREFTGRLYELATTMGAIVLPVFNTFMRLLNPIVQSLQMVADDITGIVDGVRAFANVLSGDFGRAAVRAPKVVAAVMGGGGAGGAGGGGGKTPAELRAEAAKEIVAEKDKTTRDTIKKQLEAEQERIRKRQMMDRADEQIHRRLWIEGAAKVLQEGKLLMDEYAPEISREANNPFGPGRKPSVDEAKKYAAEIYDFEKSQGNRPGPGMVASSRNALDTIDKFKSIAKGLMTTAPAVLADLKQKGLAVASQGINTLYEANRKEIERREMEQAGKTPYRAEFFEGGRDLSRSIQSAILNQNSEQKQIAAATKQSADYLKILVDQLKDAAKRAPGAVFGG